MAMIFEAYPRNTPGGLVSLDQLNERACRLGVGLPSVVKDIRMPPYRFQRVDFGGGSLATIAGDGGTQV